MVRHPDIEDPLRGFEHIVAAVFPVFLGVTVVYRERALYLQYVHLCRFTSGLKPYSGPPVVHARNIIALLAACLGFRTGSVLAIIIHR